MYEKIVNVIISYEEIFNLLKNNVDITEDDISILLDCILKMYFGNTAEYAEVYNDLVDKYDLDDYIIHEIHTLIINITIKHLPKTDNLEEDRIPFVLINKSDVLLHLEDITKYA